MQAEDLPVDERRQRQVVEQVREELPNVRVAVLSQALVVEAVDLSDLSRFVVASQDRDSFSVPNLRGTRECCRVALEIHSGMLFYRFNLLGAVQYSSLITYLQCDQKCDCLD